EARSFGLEPEADRRPGMEHEFGKEGDPVRPPRIPRQVVECHLSGDVTEVERKERRREGAHNALAQAHYRRARAPDLERHLLVPEWREEAEPFEMVEVEVGQEE